MAPEPEKKEVDLGLVLGSPGVLDACRDRLAVATISGGEKRKLISVLKLFATRG